MSPMQLFGASRSLPRPVLGKLHRVREIILLLDYDGTLVPIRRTPAAARMPVRTRKRLQRLCDQAGIMTGIVTGRSLQDILRMVGKRCAVIVANHGFEILRDGIVWVHPRAERVMSMLQNLAGRLERRLRMVPGVLIENKKYTLAVHYRRVHRRNVPIVTERVHELLLPLRNDLRITDGKKVIEARPNVPWTKGSAVRFLLKNLKREKRRLVVYIGDDTTDEDAFESLKGRAITVVVGKKKSSAKYWVRNPSEVWQFLEMLSRTISERQRQ